MRTLTFTTLYPNSQQPHHGIFVEQRLRHLVASGEVETEVIAPVPWFPFRNGSFGIYGRYASVPAEERRHDIRITHPRFPVIPKLGMSLAPLLLVKGVNTHVRDKMREGFDLIDAHYFYPDGVAAAWFGRKLGMPVVITARGTDVNLIPRYTWPRRMVLWAAKYCSRVITVSEALRSRLIELGVPEHRVITLRNGVDLAFFRPSVDREALRRELGMCRPILLSVGHLIERKGHHIAIRAMTELKDYDLIIAGDGEMEADLRRLAQTLEVDDRVRFAGALT
ncbi:MAG: glycosyltransferase, partial [Gammaproteobacteria bacterium]